MDTTKYRWEHRSALRERRWARRTGISTHDMILLIVNMAMLVLVVRIVFIFGMMNGMTIGGIGARANLSKDVTLPFASHATVGESFAQLKTIALATLIYWGLTSWLAMMSPAVSFVTKAFKATLGVMTLSLGLLAFLPEYAAGVIEALA